MDHKYVTPASDIESEESLHSFYCFCTFCYMYYGKKVNFATIFTKILTDQKIRKLYKSIICEDSDFEAMRRFISIEPSITKSKYVTKIVNKKKFTIRGQ